MPCLAEAVLEKRPLSGSPSICPYVGCRCHEVCHVISHAVDCRGLRRVRVGRVGSDRQRSAAVGAKASGRARLRGCRSRLHKQQRRRRQRTRSSVVLRGSRGAKTDVADVTRDGIRLIVAFVNDFHIPAVWLAARNPSSSRAHCPPA